MTPGGSACRRIRMLLGVFVLGGLRGQEESMVRAHLAGCARCQAECDELGEVPAFLNLLTPEEAAQARQCPDTPDTPDTLVPSPQEKDLR
jgi:anti-sigma factor RsiW